MMDHRADLLRTQAMQACLGAMNASEVHVYGEESHQWSGTVLDSDRTITTTTHWSTPEGRFRYEVHIDVAVCKRTADS